MAQTTPTNAPKVNLSDAGRYTELRQRLLFLFGALIVYRIGTFIPVPGIDPVALARLFEQQGSGSVVNLASDAGRVGSSGEAVYSAAKGGVIAFTKAVARESARHGINANAVCPGPTDTALFASMGGDNPKLREALTKAIPLRRLAQPADLANVVAFLASDEASYVTGQTVSVSGGLTMS